MVFACKALAGEFWQSFIIFGGKNCETRTVLESNSPVWFEIRELLAKTSVPKGTQLRIRNEASKRCTRSDEAEPYRPIPQHRTNSDNPNGNRDL
jgi:hypothetical protein